MSHRQQFVLSLPMFLFILCLVPPNATAQLDKGLLAGWNRSDWNHKPPNLDRDVFDPTNGFCAGAYLGGAIRSGLGWRGEILYTRKGAVIESMFTDENGKPLGELKQFYRVDYLEIPLLATWTISTRGPVRPVIYLGPALAFELSTPKIETEYPGGVDNSLLGTEDLNTSSSFDFSLVFGGGIDIGAGEKVISLQVRYVMGTQDIYLTAKNRTLSVMAGFGI